MNDIIDERSGRTDIETYGAIQSVKYAMQALEKSASKIFVRKDKLHDPVGRSLCNNFRLASRRYRENVAEKNCNLQSQKGKLGIVSHFFLFVSKKKAKEVLRKKAEKDVLHELYNKNINFVLEVSRHFPVYFVRTFFERKMKLIVSFFRFDRIFSEVNIAFFVLSFKRFFNYKKKRNFYIS